MFCAAVIRAVHKYGGLLRASVASATNDHRLGANEAPPAIISIFLGDQLTDVFDQIAKGGATSSKEKGTLTIGVDTLPVLPTDPGDRNRTSPFAFTGNRFEFRAPGSLQSIAGPMVTINTILAEALDYIATELESLVAGGTEFNAAVQKVLEEIITDHGAVVFNGDGYSDDWQIEAEARGLPNLRTTLDALPRARHRGGDGAVQPLRRVQPPGDAQPLRDRARAVRPEHRRRGPLDPRDGHHGHPARRRCATRPSWPTNVAQPQGGRRRGRHVDARRGVGADHRRCAPAIADAPRPSSATTAPTTSRRRPSTPATELLPAMVAVRAAADDARDAWSPTTSGRSPTYQEMLFIL